MGNGRRGSKVIDADLDWYYREREGDLGKRGTCLEPTIRGDAEHGPTDRQLRAAARAKDIEAALYVLDREDQSTLRLAHTPLAPGRRSRLLPLGDLAAVVVARTNPSELASALHASRSRSACLAAARAEAVVWLTSARVEAVQVVGVAVERFRAERARARLLARQERQSRIEARTAEWMGAIARAEHLRVFGRVA